MNVNFEGLVNIHTLPSTTPLLPLFEAIVNSIQGIQHRVDSGDLDSISKGLIEITIERDNAPSILENWESDIENIMVKDNGIGFNDDNYKSFNTYASDFKKALGCKGVGRIIWLKAFNHVHVTSSYHDNGTIKTREFDFDSKNEVTKHSVSINDNSEISTTIYLSDAKSKHRQKMPKKLETIAREILNHCFIYFVTEKVPTITLKDDYDYISINQMFFNIGKENISEETFSISDQVFKLIHYKNYNPSSKVHSLSLCANERSVTTNNLQNVLTGVNSKLQDDSNEFVYNGFITSDYLDKNVNRERTAFNISDEDPTIFDSVTKKQIIDAAADIILNYLSEDINNYNHNKLDYVKKYIEQKNPKYRYLLKHYPEFINEILVSDDDEKLELEIFKQEQQYKMKLKIEGKELQQEMRKNKNYKDLSSKTREYSKKISELGKSGLADLLYTERQSLIF